MKLLYMFYCLFSCEAIEQYIYNSKEYDIRASFINIYQNCQREAIKIPCGFPIKEISTIDVRSGFGKRYHPIDKIQKQHNGVDLACPQLNVMSTGAGTIIFAGYKKGFGLHIEIDHGNSYLSSYSHLSHIYVRLGEYVDIASDIGKVGSTGKSTGNHLHYEIKKNGININPANYLILMYKAVN